MWRYRANPVVPRDLLPDSNSIFNSAVVPFGNGYAGVFRVDDTNIRMTLHTGFSDDGIHWRLTPEPLKFSCDDPETGQWVYGYDPRVCRIDGRYYVTWCNGYHGPTIGVAWTEDFRTFHQLENAFLPYNRNGVLFPRRINGRFAMLSRPSDTGHTPFGDIFYSESPDLEFWGRHRFVMGPSDFDKSAWQCCKIGAGPIPIETSEGWLMFYHGVHRTCQGYNYSFGAALLDPTGELESGIPLAPPEGDAGTGMAATNAVAERTGNVSAGTSVFAMIVLEKPLSRVYPEIDMVTTPTGRPVAMVHCNNCTNEINAWAEVFRGFLEALGQKPDMNAVFTAMFSKAYEGEADAGALVLYNYLSGEPITGMDEGRPLLVRSPEAKLNFANFMRAQLYSALATLKIGLDILADEHVNVDRLLGHGGFFKTPEVGQRILAAAANSPVSVMTTAGEGGPWGMALLAAYRANRAEGQTLEDYLENKVFAGQAVTTLQRLPRQV